MEQIEEKKERTDFKNVSGGLELLVQLAEKGEIDPWDIDIIEVTDKYLAALDKSPRENLLNAGRAIFFARVLLRLKSDILLNISNETLLASQQTENYFPEDELLQGENEIHLDLTKLEGFLVRSSLSKHQRKRKISLSDLIFALQQAEEEEEKRALRAKLRADRAFKIVVPETPDDILEMAQEEDIDEVVEKIEAIIEEHLTDEKPITLSFLADILNNKTKPFIALLFLAHSQKVVLEQKDMYGEVFIYKGGTVLEEPKEAEKQEVKKQEKKKKVKKKSIFEKIKEKITGGKEKEIETVIENKDLVEVTVTVKEVQTESEVINNGNNTTSE
ncbi:MAG: segregation/condensation protein A [Candidatus Melainabacteria bacterium]|nr:segregation/condensation protein A [Candidatus Melainabacteria bacterium]